MINQVKSEEWYALTLSFVYFFCVLAAYYVMRPLRDQLVVEIGSAELPWFFAATFGATLLFTPLFAWIVSQWPRRIVMPLVYLLFIFSQFFFIFLLLHHDGLSLRSIGMIFFVWVSIFNLFAVSIFWSFMADIWSDEQARRLFSLIAVGGTLGAIGGPMITRGLLDVVKLPFLLGASAVLLIFAVVCILFLERWAHRFGIHHDEPHSETPIGGSMWDGLRQIFTDFFVRNISLMMLLNDAIGTIGYVLITDYSGVTFPHDPVAQTRFAATMDLMTNILQIVVQLTITRWLLVSFGAGIIFLLWSGVVVSLCLIMAFVHDPYAHVVGVMPWIAVVMIIARGLAFGMIQPAKESLYTLVSRSIRYKGKNAVDTAVWRAGDVLSMLSINGFRALGVNITGFGVIWAGLAAMSGWIGWRLANRVESHEYNNNSH